MENNYIQIRNIDNKIQNLENNKYYILTQIERSLALTFSIIKKKLNFFFTETLTFVDLNSF